MTTPKFRFGGYMQATGGGTNRAASSNYGSRPSSTNNNNKRSWSPSSGPTEAKVKSAERLSGRIRDVKAEAEANEGDYLDTMMPGGNITYREMNKARAKTAYDASKKRQEEMQRAISLAYNIPYDEKEKARIEQEKIDWFKDPANKGKSFTSTSTVDQSTSNFQNLDDEQKQFLIDSGFAAAESSGVLGGTFGAEKVVNQIKQELANAKTEGEYYNALDKLDRLNANLNTKIDPETGKINPFGATDMQQAMGLLNFDPSAVYSWADDIDRYKGGTYLKDAFYDMQSPNLTPKNYTNYMNKISAFGHGAPKGIGSFGGSGGGWGGSYGGGGGGDSGYGFSGQQGPTEQGYQRAKVGPGSLQEQVNQMYLGMGNLNAAPGFNKNRGGIISLLGV